MKSINSGSPRWPAKNTADDSGWQKAKNKRRRDVVVGNNQRLTKVKGVPRIVELRAYRIDPNTTPDDLKGLLRPHFPEVTCEPLTSRHPQLCSSYRVAIYETHFDAAMIPDIWPSGACIRRFLYLRRKQSQATE